MVVFDCRLLSLVLHQVCAEFGCDECPDCCMKMSKGDKSFTQIAMYQACTMPKRDHSFFVIGDSCSRLHGGLSVVFDASCTSHGFWLNPRNLAVHYAAVEFVKK